MSTDAPFGDDVDRLTFEVDGADRVARCGDDGWLRELRILTIDGDSGPRTTPPETESMLVVLDGTHDLFAGAGSWVRRGVRRTPFDGRPVAVFLPPATRYELRAGHGRAAVVTVARPRPAAAAGETDLAARPLLPLAGSQKSFDPVSKAWRPTESFPGSPEALLPRRIERIALDGGARVDRIAGEDYKTLGLAVDELHAPEDTVVTVTGPSAAGYPAEVAVVLAIEGSAEIVGATGTTPIANGGSAGLIALRVHEDIRIRATRGRVYGLIAYAGRKSTG